MYVWSSSLRNPDVNILYILEEGSHILEVSYLAMLVMLEIFKCFALLSATKELLENLPFFTASKQVNVKLSNNCPKKNLLFSRSARNKI